MGDDTVLPEGLTASSSVVDILKALEALMSLATEVGINTRKLAKLRADNGGTLSHEQRMALLDETQASIDAI